MKKLIIIILLALTARSFSQTVANNPYITFGTQPDTLNLLVIFGQSQAGGFDSSQPARTTDTEAGVYTFTDGPLEANAKTGDLVLLTEGDALTLGGTDASTETYTSGALRYAKTRANSSRQVFVGAVGYYGGATLPTLIKGGGNSTAWTSVHDAIVRGYEIAQDSGWAYRVFAWLSHGGSTSANYSTTVAQWQTDVNFVVDSLDSAIPTYFFADQQRVTTPDLGIQIPDVAGIDVLLARQDAVEVDTDNIHLTSDGSRHLGVYGGYYMGEIINGRTYNSMTIDEANITLSGTVITCPVLNSVGTLVGSGDYDIEVYDATNAQVLTGSWAINGTNLEFTVSNAPVGSTNIEIRTDRGTGSLRDSRPNTGMVLQNTSAQPYQIYQHLIRKNHTATLTFAGTAPTDITISANSINENTTGKVGDLSSNGNPVGTFTITGGADQANFTITNTDDLEVSTSFDYETQTTALVQITCTNASGSFAETLTININDVDDSAPIDSVLIARINFGGSGADPVVSGWSSVNPWQSSNPTNKYTDNTYTLSCASCDADNDSVTIYSYNNTDDHWGFQSTTNVIAGDAGAGTGSDSGVVPDNVLDKYWFVESDSATVGIRGTAIDNTKQYSLNMGGSRATATSRITSYHVGGVSKTSEGGQNNSTDFAEFSLVSPSSGEIRVSATNTNNSFGYLNWIEVWELIFN